MLRMGMQTKEGPIAIIGINSHNKVRMEAGMPLRIDLREITPPGMRITEVIVHYAETYGQVLLDMAQQGLTVPEELIDQAEDLDKQIEREMLAKRANGSMKKKR